MKQAIVQVLVAAAMAGDEADEKRAVAQNMGEVTDILFPERVDDRERFAAKNEARLQDQVDKGPIPIMVPGASTQLQAKIGEVSLKQFKISRKGDKV